MFNFCSNKNFNEGINFMIMQSNLNKGLFFEMLNRTEYMTGEEVLRTLDLSKEDFINSDWNEVSRCL